MAAMMVERGLPAGREGGQSTERGELKERERERERGELKERERGEERGERGEGGKEGYMRNDVDLMCIERIIISDENLIFIANNSVKQQKKIFTNYL